MVSLKAFMRAEHPIAPVVWKQVPGFPFEASSYGDIRRPGSKKLMHVDPWSYDQEYWSIQWIDRFRTHRRSFVARLVCAAFHGPIPERYVVHHPDGDHRNNKPENLIAVSRRVHREIHREMQKGKPKKNAPLTDAQKYRAILLYFGQGLSALKISWIIGGKPQAIRYVIAAHKRLLNG